MKLDEYQIPKTFVNCSCCNQLLHEDCFTVKYTRDGIRVRMKVCRTCVRRRREGSPARKRAAVLIDEARSKPCVDCGNTFPPACVGLSAPKDAEFCPSKEAGRVSEKRLLAMLSKCVPVCANCRAIRQANKHRARRVPRLRGQSTPMLEALAPEILAEHLALAESPSAPADLGALARMFSQRLTDLPTGQGSAPKPESLEDPA